MIVDTEKLTAIIGCSPRSLTLWVGEGLPVHTQGGSGRGHDSTFETVDVIAWLRDRAVSRARRETPDGRLRKLQADDLEMKIMERAGKLVIADDVERLWTEAIVAARTELLSLADRLKGRLDSTYRINIDPAVIENEVMSSLNKLATNPPTIEAEVSQETSSPENEPYSELDDLITDPGDD